MIAIFDGYSIANDRTRKASSFRFLRILDYAARTREQFRNVRAQEVFGLVAEVWVDEGLQRCFRDDSADLPLPAPTR